MLECESKSTGERRLSWGGGTVFFWVMSSVLV